MPSLPSPDLASHADSHRPHGITGIVIVHWVGAGILTFLALFFLFHDLFSAPRTESPATGVPPLAIVLFSSAWILWYIARGLWRMHPGPYIVAIFFYVLATLAQLGAFLQGYDWLSIPALITAGIGIYLLLPRTWWSFYPKPTA